MRIPVKLAIVATIACLLLSACGKEQVARKETFPVKGEVYVDGQPADGLAVTCHNVAGLDKEQPTSSSAFTDSQGKFEISTYESADGVPEGEYVLTFMWGKWNTISMTYGGPDKLNGRYDDPKTSEFKVSVQKGKPTDLGRIELTTK